VRYSIVSYGVFHLARVVAFKYTGKENWDNPDETSNWIDELQTKASKLNRHYNINNVFKAGDIEGAINRQLHKT